MVKIDLFCCLLGKFSPLLRCDVYVHSTLTYTLQTFIYSDWRRVLILPHITDRSIVSKFVLLFHRLTTSLKLVRQWTVLLFTWFAACTAWQRRNRDVRGTLYICAAFRYPIFFSQTVFTAFLISDSSHSLHFRFIAGFFSLFWRVLGGIVVYIQQ